VGAITTLGPTSEIFNTGENPKSELNHAESDISTLCFTKRGPYNISDNVMRGSTKKQEARTEGILEKVHTEGSSNKEILAGDCTLTTDDHTRGKH